MNSSTHMTILKDDITVSQSPYESFEGLIPIPGLIMIILRSIFGEFILELWEIRISISGKVEISFGNIYCFLQSVIQ